MKAATYQKYGSPDVLELKDISKPFPGDNEVLIKIHRSSVTIVDSTFRKGNDFFARLFTGITKPKNNIPGGEIAGEIVEIGKDVKRFIVGDRVFGPTSTSFGGHAEYICMAENEALSIIPDKMDYEEAGVISYGFLTALPFIRDAAKIHKGQKILIIGASGGVGTIAVQLAHYFKAHVTAVCGTDNVELVKSLGADKVIDYKKEDYLNSNETYDIVFDAAGKSSYTNCKKILKNKGIFLETVLSFKILGHMLATSIFGSKKAIITFTGMRSAVDKIADLSLLKELYEAGKIKTTVGKSFRLSEIKEAFKYVEGGHKTGNVSIVVSD